MHISGKWRGARGEIAEYIAKNQIPSGSFRFLGIDEWQNVYEKILECFIDWKYAKEHGIYWSNIENGFRKDIPVLYRFQLGARNNALYNWIERLPEIVKCDKVYLLIEDSLQHYAGHWIAECAPSVVHLVINDTYLPGDYYITDKKFNWLITENHHEIISFIGKGLDLEAIKNVCTKQKYTKHGGRLLMDKKTYSLIEKYMLSCMKDSAHDKEHIYRVLYNALEIAKTETNVDYDVLICACLLHDIARSRQFKDPSVCHAQEGGNMAYSFLLSNRFKEDYADKVRHCIQTHRFRSSNPPLSLEAKILFDADKLDVSGAIGIARTLVYKGIVSEPIYSLLPDGTVSSGEGDTDLSFFQEYKYKLENLYSKFYTKTAEEIAKERQKAAIDFYNNLYREIRLSYQNGKEELKKIIPEI